MAKRRDIARVCSWCGKHIGGPDPLYAETLSHSMCDDCRERWYREAGLEPPRKNPVNIDPVIARIPMELCPDAVRQNPSMSHAMRLARGEFGIRADIRKAFEQLGGKTSIDAAINFLKKRARELHQKYVLPLTRRELEYRRRTSSGRNLGHKDKVVQVDKPFDSEEEAKTYQRRYGGRIVHRADHPVPLGRWVVVRAKVIKDVAIPWPESRSPLEKNQWTVFAVRYLWELGSLLEDALAGMAPVPPSWRILATLEAHQMIDTLEWRYKSMKSAIAGLRRKAKSLRMGTKTRRGNEPAAMLLEQHARTLEEQLLRQRPGGIPTSAYFGEAKKAGEKMPDDKKLGAYRKRTKSPKRTADYEAEVLRILFQIKRDPELSEIAEAIGGNPQPWRARHPVNESRLEFSVNRRKYVVEDYRGTRPPGVLSVTKGGRKHRRTWFLDEKVKVVGRLLDGDPIRSHGQPFENDVTELRAQALLKAKAYGPLFRVAAQRWHYEQHPKPGEMLVSGREIPRAFDVDQDVRTVWEGSSEGYPMRRIASVFPSEGPRFYIATRHVPDVPGAPAGGVVFVHFIELPTAAAPPARVRKALLDILTIDDAKGLNPSSWEEDPDGKKVEIPRAVVLGVTKTAEQEFAKAYTRANPAGAADRWYVNGNWLVERVSDRKKGGWAKKGWRTLRRKQGDVLLLFGCPKGLLEPSGKCRPSKKAAAAAKRAVRKPPKSGLELASIKRRIGSESWHRALTRRTTERRGALVMDLLTAPLDSEDLDEALDVAHLPALWDALAGAVPREGEGGGYGFFAIPDRPRQERILARIQELSNPYGSWDAITEDLITLRTSPKNLKENQARFLAAKEAASPGQLLFGLTWLIHHRRILPEPIKGRLGKKKIAERNSRILALTDFLGAWYQKQNRITSLEGREMVQRALVDVEEGTVAPESEIPLAEGMPVAELADMEGWLRNVPASDPNFLRELSRAPASLLYDVLLDVEGKKGQVTRAQAIRRELRRRGRQYFHGATRPPEAFLEKEDLGHPAIPLALAYLPPARLGKVIKRMREHPGRPDPRHRMLEREGARRLIAGQSLRMNPARFRPLAVRYLDEARAWLASVEPQLHLKGPPLCIRELYFAVVDDRSMGDELIGLAADLAWEGMFGVRAPELPDDVDGRDPAIKERYVAQIIRTYELMQRDQSTRGNPSGEGAAADMPMDAFIIGSLSLPVRSEQFALALARVVPSQILRWAQQIGVGARRELGDVNLVTDPDQIQRSLARFIDPEDPAGKAKWDLLVKRLTQFGLTKKAAAGALAMALEEGLLLEVPPYGADDDPFIHRRNPAAPHSWDQRKAMILEEEDPKRFAELIAGLSEQEGQRLLWELGNEGYRNTPVCRRITGAVGRLFNYYHPDWPAVAAHHHAQIWTVFGKHGDQRPPFQDARANPSEEISEVVRKAQEMWEQLQKEDDQVLWGRLFGLLHPILCGFLLQRFPYDREHAEDVAMQAWATMLEKLREKEKVPSVFHTLKLVAYRRMIDRIRKTRRYPESTGLTEQFLLDKGVTKTAPLRERATDWASALLQDASPTPRQVELVGKAVAQMGENGELLRMAYLEQMPLQEIADKTGLSNRAIRSRLYRAREQIAARLETAGIELPRRKRALQAGYEKGVQQPPRKNPLFPKDSEAFAKFMRPVRTAAQVDQLERLLAQYPPVVLLRFIYETAANEDAFAAVWAGEAGRSRWYAFLSALEKAGMQPEEAQWWAENLVMFGARNWPLPEKIADIIGYPDYYEGSLLSRDSLMRFQEEMNDDPEVFHSQYGPPDFGPRENPLQKLLILTNPSWKYEPAEDRPHRLEGPGVQTSGRSNPGAGNLSELAKAALAGDWVKVRKMRRDATWSDLVQTYEAVALPVKMRAEDLRNDPDVDRGRFYAEWFERINELLEKEMLLRFYRIRQGVATAKEKRGIPRSYREAFERASREFPGARDVHFCGWLRRRVGISSGPRANPSTEDLEPAEKRALENPGRGHLDPLTEMLFSARPAILERALDDASWDSMVRAVREFVFAMSADAADLSGDEPTPEATERLVIGVERLSLVQQEIVSRVLAAMTAPTVNAEGWVPHHVVRWAQEYLKRHGLSPDPDQWHDSDAYARFMMDLWTHLGLAPNARRNPSTEDLEPAEKKALEKQYRSFHGSAPREVLEQDAPPGTPHGLVVIGELDHLGYAVPPHSGKAGPPFRHYFGHENPKTGKKRKRRGERPLLATDAEGKHLFIVGGAYAVRPEGIVG